MSTLATEIREAILNDLTGRSGIGNSFDDIDDDIREEINDTLDEIIQEKIAGLQRLDAQAAEYVETPIIMRTSFTGEQPYVGWKGLGLAMEQALDERDALKTRVHALEAAMCSMEHTTDVEFNWEKLGKPS